MFLETRDNNLDFLVIAYHHWVAAFVFWKFIFTTSRKCHWHISSCHCMYSQTLTWAVPQLARHPSRRDDWQTLSFSCSCPVSTTSGQVIMRFWNNPYPVRQVCPFHGGCFVTITVPRRYSYIIILSVWTTTNFLWVPTFRRCQCLAIGYVGLKIIFRKAPLHFVLDITYCAYSNTQYNSKKLFLSFYWKLWSLWSSIIVNTCMNSWIPGRNKLVLSHCLSTLE